MAENSTSQSHTEHGAALSVARRLARVLGLLSRPTGGLLAVVWYGFIYTMSSQSSLGRPGPITGYWLLNTGHTLLFGLLALWILLALPRHGGWPIVRLSSTTLVLLLVLILGALDELHQGNVPGRVMSASDVLTDLTGAACVLWICSFSGGPHATEKGLRLRLLLCLTACATAGGLATLSDNYLGW